MIFARIRRIKSHCFSQFSGALCGFSSLSLTTGFLLLGVVEGAVSTLIGMDCKRRWGGNSSRSVRGEDADRSCDVSSTLTRLRSSVGENEASLLDLLCDRPSDLICPFSGKYFEVLSPTSRFFSSTRRRLRRMGSAILFDVRCPV